MNSNTIEKRIDIQATKDTLEKLRGIVSEHYAKLIDDSPNAQPSTWDMWESDSLSRDMEIQNVIQMLEDYELKE